MAEISRGRFLPGQSGNPGGRPKALAEVTALARAETAANIAALVRIRDDAASPPAAVVTAATALLDRAWGKPKQEIEGEVAVGVASYVIRAPATVQSTQEWLE